MGRIQKFLRKNKYVSADQYMIHKDLYRGKNCFKVRNIRNFSNFTTAMISNYASIAVN